MSTEVNMVESNISKYLENKKVKVVPIVREGGYLPKNHDGEFMYTGTKMTVRLPINRAKNQLESILTREEQAAFEAEMYLKSGDLSTYNKTNEFWTTFKVELTKDGIELDLSDPIDNLKHRILKVDKHVASSWESRYDNASYKFALVDADYQETERVKKSDKIKEAYKLFGKIDSSVEKMTNVLKVYGLKVPTNAKLTWLKTEIDKIIESDIEGFLSISQDEDFDWRLLIEDAVNCKAIIKSGKTAYSLPGGEQIGSTLDKTIEYLKDPRYNDVLLTIKARIAQVK